MKQSKPVTITGWVLTGLVAAFVLFSAVMKLMKPDAVVESFTHLGYPDSTILPIAITEIACVLIFLIPRTAPFGAILLTGYLGGAIATHVRVEESFITPAIIAVVAWIGLYLRMPKVRALVSILKPLSSSN
jgi:uncharacterized membrane protein YphA (DoxX/SURF4 family)